MPKKEYLILRCHLDASPAEAYRAWFDPDQLKRWWGSEAGDKSRVVDADVRVGGAYRIMTKKPEGEVVEIAGEYCELVPNKRISFTWRSDGDPGSIVTAEVEPDGNGTALTLTHQGLSSKEEREGLKRGWLGALQKLERVFEH